MAHHWTRRSYNISELSMILAALFLIVVQDLGFVTKFDFKVLNLCCIRSQWRSLLYGGCHWDLASNISYKVQHMLISKPIFFQAPLIYTMLFFDEANTTDAIGLIKEILCDRRMRGVPLQEDTGLKIIAACNPYKRYYTFY